MINFRLFVIIFLALLNRLITLDALPLPGNVKVINFVHVVLEDSVFTDTLATKTSWFENKVTENHFCFFFMYF